VAWPWRGRGGQFPLIRDNCELYEKLPVESRARPDLDRHIADLVMRLIQDEDEYLARSRDWAFVVVLSVALEHE